MPDGQVDDFAPVSGDEFRPALAKLWTMLIVFALMIPAGALAAFGWWFQVPLFGGRVLSAKAGIVGLLAIPLGMFLVMVGGVLLALAKRLVIGTDRVQLLSRGRVAIEIPFRNVAAVFASGEGNAGAVGLQLLDRKDPATRVPSWTRDRYEIQVLTYGKPLKLIHDAVNKRFQEYRASAGEGSTAACDDS
jgi:hypothetical protein